MTTEIVSPAATMLANVDASDHASNELTEVAGYKLECRLGSGGYGEVWRAIGPGGLAKAVKILHGKHDGREAETELKALERMRELRHPFLLSIERIEVVEGKLVIVSELAEASLEDRFRQCKEAGRRGIPRDELLTYLRDAADALDFMYDGHGLQHLDIKPGNLLIQGGHVKVGDFGLIKDLNQSRASMIGGFTPLYAPPELFEGRPARNSDQYSLAIVYQILATGEAPFAGRTAAQLMSQHMHSDPDISTLLPSDRPAVAKALSKSPGARFSNCRQFVDQLLSRKVLKSPSAAGAESEKIQAGNANGERLDQTTESVVPRIESKPLPPVVLKSEQAAFRPTVFVGIGGLGGRVLCDLRSEFSESYGIESHTPALQMLHIDTDSEAMKDLQRSESGLRANESLSIPLRDTTGYRAGSRELMEWLSRRWLYNIPRSKLVERMRPLGRLALVDHHETIRRRLTECIERAIGEEAIRETSETTGISADSSGVDIVLVASTSGGTGSGSALDAAYLVRDVLSRMELSDYRVTGCLLHTNDARHQLNRLERANSIAFLSELERYSNPKYGYPGDRSCRLAASNEGPFDVTYLVSIDQAAEDSFDQQTGKVAQYLFRSTLTTTHEFFAKCRAGDQGKRGSIRTFGVAALNDAAQQDAEREAAEICRVLIERWGDNLEGGLASSATNDEGLQQRTNMLLSAFELEAPKLVAKVSTILRGQLGQLVEGYFDEIWKESHQAGAKPAALLTRLDSEFACEDVSPTMPAHPRNVIRLIEEQLKRTAQQASETLRTEIEQIANHTEQRFEGCRAVLEAVVARIARISQELSPLSVQIANDLSGRREQADEARTEKEIHEQSKKYWMLKFGEAVYGSLDEYLLDLRRTARECVDSMPEYRRHLDESMRAFGTLAEIASASGEGEASHGSSPIALLAAAFDQYLVRSQKVNVVRLFSDDPQPGQRLFMDLRTIAFDFLTDASHHGNSEQVEGEGSQSTQAKIIDDARSRIKNVGGHHRVLALIPHSMPRRDWERRLAREFGNCVTMEQWSGPKVWACCEVEGISAETMRAWLACGDMSLIETADRVHTRIDVDWE